MPGAPAEGRFAGGECHLRRVCVVPLEVQLPEDRVISIPRHDSRKADCAVGRVEAEPIRTLATQATSPVDQTRA